MKPTKISALAPVPLVRGCFNPSRPKRKREVLRFDEAVGPEAAEVLAVEPQTAGQSPVR